MFVDQVRIFVQAGSGGNGACSFRREKYVPRGGPDGGDGGNGGSVILQPSHRLTTLLDLRYQQEYRAEPGRPGERSNRHGKTAPDVVISVPVGTLVMDDESGAVLADLTDESKPSADVRVGWVRLSGWLPWMQMSGRQGELYFHTAGRKLGSWDEIPEGLKAEIRASYPEYVAPPPLDDARPNETSWTYFKKKVKP